MYLVVFAVAQRPSPKTQKAMQMAAVGCVNCHSRKAAFCQSKPPSVLVKPDANAWSDGV